MVVFSYSFFLQLAHKSSQTKKISSNVFRKSFVFSLHFFRHLKRSNLVFITGESFAFVRAFSCVILSIKKFIMLYNL